jgi:hypothetical protein
MAICEPGKARPSTEAYAMPPELASPLIETSLAQREAPSTGCGGATLRDH